MNITRAHTPTFPAFILPTTLSFFIIASSSHLTPGTGHLYNRNTSGEKQKCKKEDLLPSWRQTMIIDSHDIDLTKGQADQEQRTAYPED
jgi:hypothetical protein